MVIMQVEDISQSYPGKRGSEERVEVLKNISFSVEEKEFVSIMGRSGCGKTTLLKVLGLIDIPDTGKVFFKGRDTDEISESDTETIRRTGIGYVFQDYYLMDSLSVRENIGLPLILDNEDVDKMLEKIEEYAGRYNLAHLLDKKPPELSGGEKQRVAICRALIHDPDLVLADEPTGNLDSKSGQIVIDTLLDINKHAGKAIVMVTHDPKMASYSNTVIFIRDGKILDTIHREGSQDEFSEKILQGMKEL